MVQEKRATLTGRRHFAAGDYITKYPDGSRYELRIDSEFTKPDWQERKPGSPTRPVFPGSTIRFEDKFYEVLEIGQETELPKRTCYYLKHWEDHFPIRTQFVYSREECEKLLQQRKKEGEDSFHQFLIFLFYPFVGLLPASDQYKLQNRYGVSPGKMTFASLLLVLIPSVLATFALAAYSLGASLPGPQILHPLFFLGPYFSIESFLRLYSCGKLEEPMGSLILALPIEAYRTLRRNFDPEYKRKQFERLKVSGNRAALLQNAKDKISTVKDKDYDLEIRSVLPKPHWGPATGIEYLGDWYLCTESGKEKENGDLSYYFHLHKIQDATVFRTTTKYTPDEVRELYRAQVRVNRSTWVEPLAPLWGVLDAPDQKQLATIYRYEPLRFTKWSIIVLGLFSISNLVVIILNLIGGVAGTLDVILFVPCVYLLLESISRWNLYRQKEPSGSLLGKLVRPLISNVLEVKNPSY
ncbi:MAG: hypothetical protein C5B54_10620 [Acidobacteria bacterium]|nr:MAG: hypothetical protein C5B54_10620 [Acidobacteriota bacterium]